MIYRCIQESYGAIYCVGDLIMINPDGSATPLKLEDRPESVGAVWRQFKRDLIFNREYFTPINDLDE